MIPKRPHPIYRRGPYLHVVAQRLGLLLVATLTVVLAIASCTGGRPVHGKGPVTEIPTTVAQPGTHKKGR